jgi:hypothetical protein
MLFAETTASSIVTAPGRVSHCRQSINASASDD